MMAGVPKTPVVGILLAAGASTRFGGDKLLQPLHDGMLVGVRSAMNLRSAVDDLLVVLRRPDSPLRTQYAERGIACVVCEDARNGQGHSLAHAVAARADAAGWVIALADMPFIRPGTLAAVTEAVRAGAGIVAPCCGGRRGHPVGFGHRFGDALCQLRGDEGARGVLRAHPDAVRLLDCDDAGVLADVDTPAALAAGLRMFSGPADVPSVVAAVAAAVECPARLAGEH